MGTPIQVHKLAAKKHNHNRGKHTLASMSLFAKQANMEAITVDTMLLCFKRIQNIFFQKEKHGKVYSDWNLLMWSIAPAQNFP